ncbi:microtubule-associated serine/threonine-protein kinase 3-like [Protopterus annectens]|uniref:microtubule-associated serine/threonine-protein kinase 3-like n=1 Tax=Protopterus annectens TaxID=7888 RepID=UPI001CFB2842|nr:microtubule-associated serine/threonine-protein kinase 3-like [Protopterus annectens]
MCKIGAMNSTTDIEKIACEFQDGEMCGTPEYMAPEVILQLGYGKPVDWWAMGIIFYEIFLGFFPFCGASHDETLLKVIADGIPWPNRRLPASVKDMIEKLLKKDPVERLGTTGAHEVKQHPFLKNLEWNRLQEEKPELALDLLCKERSYFHARTAPICDDQYEEESFTEEPYMKISNFNCCSPQFYQAEQKNRMQNTAH